MYEGLDAFLLVGPDGKPGRAFLLDFFVDYVLQASVLGAVLLLQLVDVVQVAPLVVFAQVLLEDLIELLSVQVFLLDLVSALAADVAEVLLVLLHPLCLVTQLCKGVRHQTADHVSK